MRHACLADRRASCILKKTGLRARFHFWRSSMTAGSRATRILVWALFATPALAADVLPLTAAQKANLGVVTVQAAASGTSPALAFPARVTLPPASVHVVAVAGDALVTRLHVQAGDTVKRGA